MRIKSTELMNRASPAGVATDQSRRCASNASSRAENGWPTCAGGPARVRAGGRERCVCRPRVRMCLGACGCVHTARGLHLTTRRSSGIAATHAQRTRVEGSADDRRNGPTMPTESRRPRRYKTHTQRSEQHAETRKQTKAERANETSDCNKRETSVRTGEMFLHLAHAAQTTKRGFPL